MSKEMQMARYEGLKRRLAVDHLNVEVYEKRQQMGQAAGLAVAQRMRDLLATQETVTMIFAAAPSQDELLETLTAEKDLDWKRVIALHMDEYIGLPEDSPEHFRDYLKKHLMEKVSPGQVHFLNGNAESVDAECERYAQILLDHPVDIVCCGIGENGHLAFNDPPVADFLDPKIVKVVELEHACRQQQVNDGCFPSLGDVPTHALSLTIPALLSARYVYCVVPGPTKMQAVQDSVHGPISTECPASILRRHFRSILYVDKEAAGQIDGN
jgi:glucosamine-6-phosphate deaminase